MQKGEMYSQYLYFQICFLTSISSPLHCTSAKNGKAPGLLDTYAFSPNHQASVQNKQTNKATNHSEIPLHTPEDDYNGVGGVGKTSISQYIEKLEPCILLLGM